MTEKLNVPPIDWRNIVSLLETSPNGKNGYVGTFGVKLFTYWYGSGQKPWWFVTTLPGYASKRWSFSTETDAEAFARLLLTKFLTKIFTAEETGNA